MFAAAWEPAVTAFPVFRLAVVALAISLALSACGRRGPLDPPPRAAAQANPQQQPSSAESTEDDNGNPVMPAAQKKRFFLDFLLN